MRVLGCLGLSMELQQRYRRGRLICVLACTGSCGPIEKHARTEDEQLSPPFQRLWRTVESDAVDISVDESMGVWTVSVDGVVRRFEADGSLSRRTALLGVSGWPTLAPGPDGAVYVAAEVDEEQPSSAVWLVDADGTVRWSRRWQGIAVEHCASDESGQLVIAGSNTRNAESTEWVAVLTPSGETRWEATLDAAIPSLDEVTLLDDRVFATDGSSAMLWVLSEGTAEVLPLPPNEVWSRLTTAGDTLIGLGGSRRGRRIEGRDADGQLEWEHQTSRSGFSDYLLPTLRPVAPGLFIVSATLQSEERDPEGRPIQTMGQLRLYTNDGVEVASDRIDDEGASTFLTVAAGRCSEDGHCRIAVRGTHYYEASDDSVSFLDMYDVDLSLEE